MKRPESWIRRTQFGLLEAIVLDNGLLRLTVVPELGGKIVCLGRLESGHEFHLQPSEPKRAYRPRSYGAKFDDYEPSGFDECVPTIAECRYPEEPFSSRLCPDHGDVWCLPSSAEIVGEQIILATSLRSLPLLFSKKVQLQANTVRIDYEVTNLNSSTVKFLWSAHPLLIVESETEIVLPEEVKEVEIGWSRGERLGKSGDRCRWPNAMESSGQLVQLNRAISASAGTAEKVFTPRLSEGFCGLFLSRANESIAFRFDTRLVPYVGIWVCQVDGRTTGLARTSPLLSNLVTAGPILCKRRSGAMNARRFPAMGVCNGGSRSK